jgi:hypothetical protein
VLIIAVFIIYQQIQFIQNTNPGYNKNNVLRLSAEGGLSTSQDAFIAALKNIPALTMPVRQTIAWLAIIMRQMLWIGPANQQTTIPISKGLKRIMALLKRWACI